MAEQAQRRPATAQQAAEQGIIAATLIRLAQIVMYLVLTLVFSILVEWIGMAAGLWDEPGAQHSERMLQQELQYLNEDFTRSAIVEQPVRYAERFSKHFYDLTFKKTGIQSAVIWLATPTQTHSGTVRKSLHRLFRMTEEYVLAAMTVTQIFAVRLAVLTLALPVAVAPSNEPDAGNWLELIKGYAKDAGLVIGLIIAVVAFLWIGWITIAKFNEARAGAFVSARRLDDPALRIQVIGRRRATSRRHHHSQRRTPCVRQHSRAGHFRRG